jgi:4-amino-4-deoxy-L-arabinose transferase-like glycosyltransferase
VTRDRWLLAGALLLLFVPVWIEPAGSWLGEPDEARYAEIPREMLAAGDFVTPRLNGVPYFEKPPLLYWCNAASLSIFGETPWAARLPTRLAGLGTVVVLLTGVASIASLELGLAAGILYLASPMGFVFSRVNLTDGLLTFFFTATLFAARETIARRLAGRPWLLWSAAAGLAGAGAFLTKGLVGVLFPGGILVVWAFATHRIRVLSSLLVAPAPLVFLAAVVPWFALASARNPGFLYFFFVHEHFQRFATTEAHRPGPFYYFAGIFLAGFLPALPFFFASLRGGTVTDWIGKQPDRLFLLIWFLVVMVVFSLSSSKLPPYILPAIPAAAALAAGGLGEAGRRSGRWRACALLATALAAGVLAVPATRSAIDASGLFVFAGPGLLLLLAGAWAAPVLASRGRAPALAAFAVGWFGIWAAAALSWPRVPPATELHNLEIVARDTAQRGGAQVVGYQSYVQGLPWELKHPIPLADYVGELEPQFERDPHARDALFWTREKFWSEWRSGKRMVAVVRPRDVEEFTGARLLHRTRKYFLIANFD